MELVRASKWKRYKQDRKKAIVCLSKKSDAEEAITEIKWCGGWDARGYRNVYNKKRTGKFSAIYEGRQKCNRNKKKKTETDLEKE